MSDRQAEFDKRWAARDAREAARDKRRKAVEWVTFTAGDGHPSLTTQELPPGLVGDEGVFYPFMVDCPSCVCDTSDYCAHCSEGVVLGTHGTEPCKCDGTGQVRNPDLEWLCAEVGHNHWYADTFSDTCLLVAVGVKEVSE